MLSLFAIIYITILTHFGYQSEKWVVFVFNRRCLVCLRFVATSFIFAIAWVTFAWVALIPTLALIPALALITNVLNTIGKLGALSTFE